MSICIIDTSILCELLNVPKLNEHFAKVDKEFRQKVGTGETLLLPPATILETGNHIGQVSDGRLRRGAAERFLKTVTAAVLGTEAFTPTRFFNGSDLVRWLPEFPNWVKQKSGVGDLTIKQEFDRLCALNRLRRVYIWSTDRHLASFDRSP